MEDPNIVKNNDQPLLQVSHLRTYFDKGRFRAVDDISFDIHKGEVFGLVGESGCGKTTTGRSIIGLYDISGGNVSFEGKLLRAGTLDYRNAIKAARVEYKHGSISKAELDKAVSSNLTKIKEAEALRHKGKFETKIQMIYQDPVSSLDPRMTIREIIAEGLRIRGVRDERQIGMTVAKALTRVGLLSEYADRYPHEFSGGQRQRIGIARAIIMNPQLIIADEPISALDVSIKAQVINLLNELRRDLGLTVLFIAHDLSVVKYFCDRIAVMYAGKIVELAPADELFAHPLHPYTRSLLSAVPLPDPHYERKRSRLTYQPEQAHDYTKEKPVMRQLTPTHSVWCNREEAAIYTRELEGDE
ncbi:MAG: ABC transporter ATP-binding protein [Treponema sp.]|nr:ABC transporter ATP-binding protein [Treponema sp.]